LYKSFLPRAFWNFKLLLKRFKCEERRCLVVGAVA